MTTQKPISILFENPVSKKQGSDTPPPKKQHSSLLILAHGAGAPMDSPFMNVFSAKLAGKGVGVVRFEFPYMEQRRYGGSKRPPDKQEILLERWKSLLLQLQLDPLFRNVDSFFLGGKSMGGRMATLVLNEALEINTFLDSKVKGVVCLGYPFHPIGKPEKLRTAHLPSLNKPLLIVQGERDTLGNQDEVKTYSLGDNTTVKWLEDGDHDLKPRKKSGFTHDQHIDSAVAATANFIQGL